MKRILALCTLLVGFTAHTLHGDILLNDAFGYGDGSITAGSGGKWANHSGTGTADVSSGKLVLSTSKGEDINAILAGQPYLTNSGAMLYAGFTVNFSALPTGTGTYFAHFKDSTTSGFRCRVFAVTNNAADGLLRLGVAPTGSAPLGTLNTDLALNTDYRVIIRYSVADGASTIWLNPTSESVGAGSTTDTGTPLPITSFAFRQATGIGTLKVDDLVVATTFNEVLTGIVEPTGAPVITTQPANKTVAPGGTATFTVGATGALPLTYEWYFNVFKIGSATASTLTLTNVVAGNAGGYFAIVRNASGSVTSSVANLTVSAAAGVTVTNIAWLRANIEYGPLNNTNNALTPTIYGAEGIVTSFVNLTGPGANVLFYMQDATAGMPVFWTGGTNQFIPRAGDKVRVIAPLTYFNGLMEFYPNNANPDHSVTLVSSNNPLPAPTLMQFSIQNDFAAVEALEGSYVVVSNVTLDVTNPNFQSGSNVTMTNQLGETFVLRVDSRVAEVIGQPKPTTPVSIRGVLGQFDSSNPRDTGYQLNITRFADIVGGTLAPEVKHTNYLSLTRRGDAAVNTFTETSLRVGDQLTIRARVTDPAGGTVAVSTPAAGLPATGIWVLSANTGTVVDATFNFAPMSADYGRSYTVVLSAANAQATNSPAWTIYVPTLAEHGVTITEFMAAPTSITTNAGFNPLARATPGTDPGTQDEYVELANLSGGEINLNGWFIADGSEVRHKFYDTFMLSSSNAVIVYGGPLNGNEPTLDVPKIPASENRFGFGLNNSGGDSIWVRNATSNLVARVVYSQSVSASGVAAVRFPDSDGVFVSQAWVSSATASPGRQYSGRLFSELPLQLIGVAGITATRGANNTVVLGWPAGLSPSFSVWSADNVAGRFEGLFFGVRATNSVGAYTVSTANSPAGFFFVTSP